MTENDLAPWDLILAAFQENKERPNRSGEFAKMQKRLLLKGGCFVVAGWDQNENIGWCLGRRGDWKDFVPGMSRHHIKLYKTYPGIREKILFMRKELEKESPYPESLRHIGISILANMMTERIRKELVYIEYLASVQ